MLKMKFPTLLARLSLLAIASSILSTAAISLAMCSRRLWRISGIDVTAQMQVPLVTVTLVL